MKKIIVILLILSMIAFGIFEVNKMAANEYVSPTGFNDPTGSWQNEPYAYDGNAHSYAIGRGSPYSWSNYLELTIEAIYCSKVKFMAVYNGTGGINSIDLDIYYDGAWHDLYEGSYLNYVYVEKSLSATQYVTKMRMRFYNSGSRPVHIGLAEAMFYETVGVPKMTTVAATDVADGEATLNGNIIRTGGVAPTIKGFEYKEGISGTVLYTYDSGYFSVGAYSKDLTGLDPTKEYYFRAYATNTQGTGYGEWLSMGEAVAIPTVTSGAATLITHEQATLNGNITETGGEDPSERGFQWKIGATGDVEELKETGEFGVGAYTLDLEDLGANVTYYFRAYAKNAGGTGYGSWLNFTTEYTVPEVVTHNATNELKNQVTGNGEIVSTGGQDSDERGFEYGLAKVATSTKSESAGSYGVGLFDLDITGLTENTDYWYRAFAKYALFNPIKKTTSAYDKEYIQMQVVGDLIHYVWYEDDPTHKQIWTATSDLNGFNFVATKRTTTSYNKYYPQLQVVGTRIYYVWSESDGSDTQIWTAVMNTDGTGWTAKKQTTTAYDKECPQLQVVNSIIYYVWYEDDGTYDQIWVATADLNSENFTATKKTTTNYNKRSPQLQVVGTVIYYVWRESDGSYSQIWVASMDTDGTGWAAVKKTTTNFTKYAPQLQVVSTKIYYVYREYDASSKWQIYVASMDTDGTDWATTKKTTSAYTKTEIQFQVVGTVIYYVWQEYDGSKLQIWTATMDTDGTDWTVTKRTTTAYDKENPQFQVVSGNIYYAWEEYDSVYQIWTVIPHIGYGEWVKFTTAAPGLPGGKPSGYKNDMCSDNSGYSFILNRSLTDDGADYESYFVLSTDLSGKKTLHTHKRLLDIFSYFANKGSGTAKIYVKGDTEPSWQYAGEVSLAGEEEILIKHLPSDNEDTEGDVDFLAKTFLIKFVFENDFEFVGAIFEAVPIGDR